MVKKLAILIISLNLMFAAQLTGKQILEKVDVNYKSTNQVVETKMVVHSRRGARTMRARSYVVGRDKAYTEYLAPARDKGTKMLKLENELWIYSPQSDRIIKIAGHMLKQSAMGSDLSYEDMLEEDTLADLYDATVIGRELFNSRDCYKLELIATKKDLSYHKRIVLVDKERFLPLVEERYAKSGKLLKKSSIEEVFKVANRWYPKKMVFKDMLKDGKGTEYYIEDIKFNQNIPKSKFTKASLRR